MIEEYKKLAAEKAVDEIKSGMVIGLGSGSTFYYALQKIGSLLKDGKLKDIAAIPSSVTSEKLAKELNIPIITFIEKQEIDVTIDGADEVDKYLNFSHLEHE